MAKHYIKLHKVPEPIGYIDENPESPDYEKEQQKVKAIIDAVPEPITYEDGDITREDGLSNP